MPAAPVLNSAIPGNGQISALFSASANNGGSPITGYTLTCNPGSLTGTGSGSPITLTGLGNGTSYTCAVAAGNAFGNSLPSNALGATPSDTAPLALLAVHSRKSHGSAGTFNLPVDISAAIGGAITVEPRALKTGQIIVFAFNQPVTDPGIATAVDAMLASIGPATGLAAGNEVIVTVNGIVDMQRATIALANVNGQANTFQASIGFLHGDVNNTRVVRAADINGVKERFGSTSEANYRFDLNLSGAVDAADLLVLKSRIGRLLP